MSIQNPKSEIRNPNAQGQSGFGSGLGSALAACIGRPASSFGFRISAFLRISDFGFRFSSAALWLLAPAFPLRAAAPISPDDIPPLRPPHAELAPTFWEHYGVWVVILGVLLLALVCGVAWLLTRPKPPVVVPPEVQARQALEPLRQQPEDGALLSRVSQILRHYVAAAFDLPTGELTTMEFCRAIDGHAQIGPDLCAALTGFLRECDQRKFSTAAPAAPFSAAAQALKLIDQAQTRRRALAQSAPPGTPTSVATPPKIGTTP